MIVIRQFISCSESPTTKDFQIDNSIYNVPGMSLFDLDTYQCYQLTENQGTTPNTNYIGPYNNCNICTDEINGWEFEDCCNPSNKLSFDITNLDVSTYVGKTVIYGGKCYNWTGTLKPTSGTFVPATTYLNCDDCYTVNGPCPSPTPTPTPSSTSIFDPSPTPSTTPTSSVTPSITLTPSITPSTTPTSSITPTSSVTPSITSTPSVTPSVTPSLTPTKTPTPSIQPLTTRVYSCCGIGGQLFQLLSGVGIPVGSVYVFSNGYCYVGTTDSGSVLVVNDTGRIQVTDCDDPSCNRCPSTTPTPTSSGIPPSTPSVTPTNSVTPSITITPSNSATPSGTPAVSVSVTPSITPSNSVTPSVTPTPTITSSHTPTPSVTPFVTPTSTPSITPSCVRDLVTLKNVLINFNSGSSYTNCDVYTGTTSNNVTGTTYCTNMSTGQSCNLTGLTATLLEIYIKISCEGCCENIYRVNLDDCCDSSDNCCGTPSPTPTSTVTPTPSTSVGAPPSPTPSITPTASVTPSVTITPSITTSRTPSVTPTSSVTPSLTPSITPTNPCSCYDVENTTSPGGNPNGTESIRFTYNDCNGDLQTFVLTPGQQGCICTLPIYYGSISVAWADASIPPPSLGTNYTIVPMTGSGGCL